MTTFEFHRMADKEKDIQYTAEKLSANNIFGIVRLTKDLKNPNEELVDPVLDPIQADLEHTQVKLRHKSLLGDSV